MTSRPVAAVKNASVGSVGTHGMVLARGWCFCEGARLACNTTPKLHIGPCQRGARGMPVLNWRAKC